MSVVAWDGQTVAADKQGTIGDSIIITGTKMRRAKNGNVLAITGTLDLGTIFMDWYDDGENPEEWPLDLQKDENYASDLLLFTPEGAYSFGRLGYKMKVEDKFMAWGCGSSFALGAMAAGAKAADAVQIASTYNPFCGNGIDIMRIKP